MARLAEVYMALPQELWYRMVVQQQQVVVAEAVDHLRMDSQCRRVSAVQVVAEQD
tara:strand:- start:8713 stop:8877 length:165 start_codon:yes stop_codon:yes gene_type:complete